MFPHHRSDAVLASFLATDTSVGVTVVEGQCILTRLTLQGGGRLGRRLNRGTVPNRCAMPDRSRVDDWRRRTHLRHRAPRRPPSVDKASRFLGRFAHLNGLALISGNEHVRTPAWRLGRDNTYDDIRVKPELYPAGTMGEGDERRTLTGGSRKHETCRSNRSTNLRSGVAPFQWTVKGLGFMQRPGSSSRRRWGIADPGLGDDDAGYTIPR